MNWTDEHQQVYLHPKAGMRKKKNTKKVDCRLAFDLLFAEHSSCSHLFYLFCEAEAFSICRGYSGTQSNPISSQCDLGSPRRELLCLVWVQKLKEVGERESLASSETGSRASLPQDTESPTPWKQRRRASTYNEAYLQRMESSPKMRKRAFSFHESNLLAKSGGKDPSLPPPCTCPYFGESSKKPPVNSGEVVIVSSDSLKLIAAKNLTVAGKSQRPENNKTFEGSNSVVTWKGNRRGSSIGSTRTVLTSSYPTPLRRAVTMKAHNGATSLSRSSNSSSPCLLRYPGVRTPHSRNSSVMSRNSSNRGNVIRIEQKATKVLGVVFFTFVILWAPFFVLNLVPAICPACEKRIDKKIFDIATWLGYSSSMVNPVFYTIFNNIFRQAFKSVLLCRYRKPAWRPVR
ncbi:hypothetical protein KQX54_011315 [Cotesia glomerata]|uniref:G-protein coupled receptors family 1 profile domain-containing protein n=1 Tax=Cotesia glomerata TaxID=32391 RepID=A0AAV7IGV5_COTGL|nr:hypothetical protein KQX54_011315 [Cotesia glomerata]